MKSISTLILICLFSLGLFAQNAQNVYFNEVRANDLNGDDVEFIELVGPAGTDLTGYVIVHHDGANASDGEVWRHTIGSFTIPDDGVLDFFSSPIGFYVVAQSATVPNADITSMPGLLQNGNGDGLVLYDGDPSGGGTLLDAIVWDGTTDMDIDDPGTVSTSVATDENNYLHALVDDDNTDFSLQGPSRLWDDDGTGWALDTATPGALNASQVSGDIRLPVELSSFSAIGSNNEVVLRWATESELDNIGFELWRSTSREGDYTEIAFINGNFTSNERIEYSFTDNQVSNENTYWYFLVDVDANGVRTQHQVISVTLDGSDPNDPRAEETITTYELVGNFPNPFNPETTLEVNVPVETSGPSEMTLTIYDVNGRFVRTLHSGVIEPGNHRFMWDGQNESGLSVPSGIYFATLSAKFTRTTIRMALTK